MGYAGTLLKPSFLAEVMRRGAACIGASAPSAELVVLKTMMMNERCLVFGGREGNNVLDVGCDDVVDVLSLQVHFRCFKKPNCLH